MTMTRMTMIKPAFEVLAEWAWEKVNITDLQKKMKESPSPELQKKIEDAIKTYRGACRQKKILDKEATEAKG